MDAGANFELNEELVRAVLNSLGYEDVSQDDLADILHQTAAQVGAAAAVADVRDDDTQQQQQQQQSQPRAGSAGLQSASNTTRSTALEQAHVTRATKGSGSAPRDEVTDDAEYDIDGEADDAAVYDPVDQYPQLHKQLHPELHHHYPTQHQQHTAHPRRPGAAAAASPPADYAHGLHDDSFEEALRAAARGGDGFGFEDRHRPQPVYRAEREYLHQQRFRDFIRLERRVRQSQSQSPADDNNTTNNNGVAAAAAAAAHAPQLAPPVPTAAEVPHARPLSRGGAAHNRSVSSSRADGETQRLQQRLGVQHHHAPMFFNRSASNVIYAFTDDKAYLPRRGNNAAKVQMAPPRRHVDVVARGQAMRQAWQRDSFLAQKGRNEERWFVRQSMLGGGLY